MVIDHFQNIHPISHHVHFNVISKLKGNKERTKGLFEGNTLNEGNRTSTHSKGTVELRKKGNNLTSMVTH